MLDDTHGFVYTMYSNADKFFVIEWLGGHDDELFDVMPAKCVVPPEGVNILNLQSGIVCQAGYEGQFYKAKVIATGKYEW